MTFKQRLPYFLVGLFIGVIVVIFIWGKKNTRFDYGPNARVLKNLSTKELIYSEVALKALSKFEIDTSMVSQVMRNGDVDLWNKIEKDSSIVYPISGRDSLEHITIYIENLTSTAIVNDISTN